VNFRRTSRVVLGALLLAGGLVSACRRAESTGGADAGAVKRYPFHGVVRDVKNGG
jgi:hypothetical protein